MRTLWCCLVVMTAVAGCYEGKGGYAWPDRARAIPPGTPEREGLVAMSGKPVALLGEPIKTGDLAPDFQAVARDESIVRFDNIRQGKIVVISAVPSLETTVCSLSTKRFNAEAARLGPGVMVVTISRDLPSSQSRFCTTEGIRNLAVLSDYQYQQFGLRYGVLVKQVRLLARAVFVVDPHGMVRHVQIVPEVTSEPDYDAMAAAVRQLQQKR